jgi:hypothetical protein
MSTSTLAEQNRRLGVVLATCCLSLFVVGVDVTIVNIALPSIQRSFGASTAGLQWTIDGYTVVLASLLILPMAATNAVYPPISNTAVSGMPPAQAGVAASIASTCRQVGATLGVAVIGSLVAGRAAGGFIAASHGGWAVVGGCGLAVLLLGLASTSGWARATAQRTRELLIAEPEEGAVRDRDSAAVS